MSHAPALLSQAAALLAASSPLAIRAAFGWYHYGVTPAADVDLAPRCDEHGAAVEVLAPSAELRVKVSVPTGPSAKYSAPLRVELVDLLADGTAARYTPSDLTGLDNLAARLAAPLAPRWGLKVSPRTFKRLDLARYAVAEGDCAWFQFDRDAAAAVLYTLDSNGLAARCARSEYTPGGPSRATLDQAAFEARFEARMAAVDAFEARRAPVVTPAPAPVAVVEAPAPAPAPAPVEVSPIDLERASRAAHAPAATRWYAVCPSESAALRACGYSPSRGVVTLPVSVLRSLAPRLLALGAMGLAHAILMDVQAAERAALHLARR